MSYYLGMMLTFAIWIGGWFLVGRWGRIREKQSTETLAWLMGGIGALMGIFAILSIELHYMSYIQ